MVKEKESISLMFSGGVDSTVAAIDLARKYKKICLLNYSNGYGHYNFENARRRYRELRKIIGDKFYYYNFSIKNIFNRILIDSLQEDYLNYKSAFIWCLGCKLAMHARSLIFNLENKIKVMADGSSSYSQEFVEQMPISLVAIKSLYKNYGMDYFNPGFGIEREKKITMLKERGFYMGFRIRDRFIGIQPKCIPGEIYYMPGILFNRFPKHCKTDVYRFISDKRQIVDNYINEYFKKNNK